MRWLATALVVLLCAWWASQTRQYAPVWANEARLSAHVAQMAPSKPRPLIYRGTTLVGLGRLDAAQRFYQAAIFAATAPHVRPFDREETFLEATRNLRNLDELRRVLSP